MSRPDDLAESGLLDARIPRYASYPSANHFTPAIGSEAVAGWLALVPAGARISLYAHVPYCRQLCWFCACRTQGTASDRPLPPYVARLKAELALIGRHLRPDVTVGSIHLGGGTPTILPAPLLAELAGALRSFRPLAADVEVAVEIDPNEIDAARMAALGAAGLSRASIGVQDFDPRVQEAIGRAQGFEATRRAAEMAREAGARCLGVDLLYGLPHQTRGCLAETVGKALALAPDRVALYGYAHVPWMAKRQALIPEAALPDSAERLRLVQAARQLLLWGGHEAVGIDHFARPGDGLAAAAREGRLRRSFQGYTDDPAEVLIGIGASAISRLPGGWAQNASTSSAWAAAVDAGRLPTERGHALTAEDRLRADMVEGLMCRFEIDLAGLAQRHDVPQPELLARTAALRRRLGPWIEVEGWTLRLAREAPLVARLAAHAVDAYATPAGRHARAV